MVAVLLAITLGGVYVGSAITARHRAQSAADLAALAAAGRLVAGKETACTWAVSVAERASGRVTSCTVDALDVVVIVEVDAVLGRWGVGAARGAARAGPAEVQP